MFHNGKGITKADTSENKEAGQKSSTAFCPILFSQNINSGLEVL